MGCTLLSLFGSGADLGAHVNVKGCKAFCFTKGPDSDAIRRAHEKLNFPFDSITEVKRVTGADLRPELTDASTPKLTGFAFKRRVNGGMEPRYVHRIHCGSLSTSNKDADSIFLIVDCRVQPGRRRLPIRKAQLPTRSASLSQGNS